ncbi:MAG: twin-arginine translocase subunit TatC [Nocardioides sp.]|uniref:twin-arginine translocase subunit TatC n=1 Tax=Nocardioides sp. TaxID=35761 RepID=UPI0039E56D78
MSFSGVVQLFAGKPVHPVGPDGKMALSDHLRELRGRIMKCALVLTVAFIIGLVFYDQIFGFIMGPYKHAQQQLPGGTNSVATVNGPGGPFLLYFKIAGLAAVVGTSPYWLYQIWAFILPGLHPHERRWSRVFAAIAGPLFIVGVIIGYVTLPKGLEVLIGFTPDSLTNLVEFSEYLSFLTRTLLVFGIAFEIPVFIVLLNLAGVVTAKKLAEHRAWIIIVVFVFAAIATPSTDPFTMCFLAFPMVGLFLVSEVIARFNDRRRRRAREAAGL